MVSVRTNKKALTAYVSPELYKKVMDFIAEDSAPYGSVSEYITGLIYRDISIRSSSMVSVPDSFVDTLLDSLDISVVQEKIRSLFDD